MMSARPRTPKTATAPGDDTLTRYLSELRRKPMLDREEEQALARRYVETHDRDTGRRLTEAHLRLVVKIAHEYARDRRHLQDLVQEGNLGLLTALDKYDPERGVRLSSYAAWWIRAYMLKYLLENKRLVRVGKSRTERRLVYALERGRLREAGDGFAAELAAQLGVSVADVESMQQRLASPELSLDAPIGATGDDRAQVEQLEDPTAARPDRLAEDAELQERFHDLLEHFAEGLDVRELAILRDRLLADDPETLEALGRRHGISRERARQLEARLLTRLRERVGDELAA